MKRLSLSGYLVQWPVSSVGKCHQSWALMSWQLSCMLGWVECEFGIAFTIICSAQFSHFVGKSVCTCTRLVYGVFWGWASYMQLWWVHSLLSSHRHVCAPTIYCWLYMYRCSREVTKSQQHSLSSLPELLCVHVQSTTSMSASSDSPSIQVQVCHFIAKYRFWMVFGVLATSTLNAIPFVEVNSESSRSQSGLQTDWSGCSHPYI